MRIPVAVLASLMLATPAIAQTAYPSGPEVPANLLRVSIEFPEPPPGAVAGRVRLTRAEGSEIAGAFYPEPLWSPDGRVLTLYLDPGRVKTGLKAHDLVGRALAAGERVQLRIGDRTLREWRVTGPTSTPLEPDRWRLETPRAETREALTVFMPAPIDRRDRDLIAVADTSGRRIAGASTLLPGERTWRFRPAMPWRKGAYRLKLHPDLEDPEGNRVARPFESRVDAEIPESQISFEVPTLHPDARSLDLGRDRKSGDPPRLHP